MSRITRTNRFSRHMISDSADRPSSICSRSARGIAALGQYVRRRGHQHRRGNSLGYSRNLQEDFALRCTFPSAGSCGHHQHHRLDAVRCFPKGWSGVLVWHDVRVLAMHERARLKISFHMSQNGFALLVAVVSYAPTTSCYW